MDHYCVGCNRSVADHRYNIVVGRCNRCAKKHIKQTKTVERIHAHYSDVCAGMLMWWKDRLVLVMEKTPTGWVVRDLQTGNDFPVVVSGNDTFDVFIRKFRHDKKSE